MNSRMKWFLLAIITIALCGFSASIFTQPTVQAKDGQPQIMEPRGYGCCDLLSGRGQGAATSADTFVVDAEFNLSGGQFSGVFGALSLQIKSTTRLLAQSPPAADGTINVITSHVFEVKGQSDEDGVCEPGEDCLVTLDRAALIPTATPGVMDLRSVLAVSDGQGRFARACGKLGGTRGEGQINFAAVPPTVYWSFYGGRLCKCP